MPRSAVIGSVAAKRRGVTNPSGQAPPSPTVTGWTNVRIEDFNTPVALGAWPTNQTAPAGYTGWSAYADGAGDTRYRNGDTTGGGIFRAAEVLSVSNSCLDWFIHTVSGEHKVADPLPPYTGPGAEGGHLYGRYQFRMKSDVLSAYKTAWLLWPDSETWPRDGEIDFPEGDLDWRPGGYIHYQDATTGAEQDSHPAIAAFDYASWHTYTLEWWPNYVKLYIDGVGFGTTWWRVPNTHMHWVFEVETTLGATLPDNATSGHVQMDWLAQWSHNSANTPPEMVGGSAPAAASGSSIVMTVPTVANGGAYKATASGDMLVVTVFAWGASALTAPGGWTQIGTTQSVAVPGQGTMQMKTFWRLWDGSTATYTFTTTGATWREGLMGVIRGQHATPVDAQNSQTNSVASTNVANTGVTATGTADLILSIAGIGDTSTGATYSLPVEPGDSGWVARTASAAMGADPIMVGASGARNGTASTSQLSLTQTIAIKHS